MHPRSRRPGLFAGLLAALFVLTPIGARAQNVSEPNEGSPFQSLVDRAIEHFQEGAYERAAEEFEAAFAIDPQPELIFNQARSLEKALRSEDAVAAYEHFLSLPGTTAEVRTRALESMAALRREAEVREQMEARPSPAPVLATPSEAPQPATPVVTETAPLPPVASRDRTLEWVLVGTGAALLAGGGVMGVLALDKNDQIDGAVAAQTPLTEVQDLQDEASRNAAIADGLFIAGAAVGITGLVLFLVRGEEDAPEVSLTPFASDGGAGVVLGGPF